MEEFADRIAKDQAFRALLPNTKAKIAREFFVTSGDIPELNVVQLCSKIYCNPD